MRPFSRVFGVTAASLTVALAVACGGKTTGEGVSSSTTGSGTGTSTGTLSNVSSSRSSTEACVEFEPLASELTCTTNSDCTSVNTGLVCADTCACGGTPINNAGAARYTAVTPPSTAECACPFFGEPMCVKGQCVAFDDAAVDAGFDGPISPPPPEDAGCFDLDVSSYPVACKTSADCIVVIAGELCADTCYCPDATISASAQAQYDQAAQAIPPMTGACGCPIEPVPSCIQNQCVICDTGGEPPAVCLDADAGATGH